MKSAIYCRVSTEEQTKNFSIENQLDHLRKYCLQHDYQIVEEYVDGGWSGTTINRPAFTKLMKDANEKHFDFVIVNKLDRLFRSNRHLYDTLEIWDKLGIKFVSITESFDTSTAIGKAMLGMTSTFAEFERNTFIERSRDGTKKTVEKGLFSGGIITYGYQFNPTTKKLEISEQEAKIVKDIYTWILEDGQSCITIAQKLNALNIPTKFIKEGPGIRSKKTAVVWSHSRVYNMLRNTAYSGVWEYGKLNKKRPTVKATCPAIVSEQIFALVKTKLSQNNHWADRNHRKPYLLRSLIKCDICGHNYTGCTSNTSGNRLLSYYRCNMTLHRYHILGDKCPSPTIRADVVEEIVWGQICEIIQNPEIAKEALMIKYDVCKQAEYISELAQLKHRLGEMKQSEQRLLVRYADSAKNISEEALNGALTEIQGNKQVVRDRMNELEKSIISEEEKNRKLNDVAEIISILRDNINIADLETKRKVFNLMVKEIRIGVNGDGATSIHIVYFFDKDIIMRKNIFEQLSKPALVAGNRYPYFNHFR